MEINVALSCFGRESLGKGFFRERHQHQLLVNDIRANALVAWQNRHTDDNVRFWQQMSGNYFRVLHLARQPNGSLLVYH